jgi:hypothetical protein
LTPCPRSTNLGESHQAPAPSLRDSRRHRPNRAWLPLG